jgi:uracil-DNA glycosylase
MSRKTVSSWAEIEQVCKESDTSLIQWTSPLCPLEIEQDGDLMTVTVFVRCNADCGHTEEAYTKKRKWTEDRCYGEFSIDISKFKEYLPEGATPQSEVPAPSNLLFFKSTGWDVNKLTYTLSGYKKPREVEVPEVNKLGWVEFIDGEKNKDYWKELRSKLDAEREDFNVAPDASHELRAFDLCSLDNLKVVIVGQDPYPGVGHADGLAFSVNNRCTIPGSLRNIFKEVMKCGEGKVMENTELECWAKQGVLLLNTMLTVRIGRPEKHRDFGWNTFTSAALKHVAENVKRPLVWVGWGKYAQTTISTAGVREGDLCLNCPHPSPLSAHGGFFGCNHFTLINNWLRKNGDKPIDWETGSR